MSVLIIFAANYLYLLVAALGLIVWLTRSRAGKIVLGLTTTVAGVAGLLLIVLASALYTDRRPFVVHHVVPLIPHPADNGFPSDHTTLTMVIALCVLTVSRRWGAVAVLAALGVGVARVAAQVHSPLDIAGAVLIAIIAVPLGRVVAIRLQAQVDAWLPGHPTAQVDQV